MYCVARSSPQPWTDERQWQGRRRVARDRRGFLDAAAAREAAIVERLTSLVNDVYAASEEGLWRRDATRTSALEMAELVTAGKIAVAMVDRELAGAIRVQALSDVTGELGMLAADPAHRGVGVGTVLVDFAEQHSRDRGMRTMQLEVLTPRSWLHPSKVFLDEWYRRIGYRVARTTRVDETYADLAPLLATPCQFVVYEKPL
jgi:ribosomal protein S18 acetylase RimI-like enzyme